MCIDEGSTQGFAAEHVICRAAAGSGSAIARLNTEDAAFRFDETDVSNPVFSRTILVFGLNP